MRPLKASLLFIYCLGALTAVGTTVSHLWTTSKQLRDETARAAASSAPAETAAPSAAVAPAPSIVPVTAEPS